MKALKFLTVFALVAGGVSRLACADVFSFTDNLSIPDGQAAGVSDVQTISSGVSKIGSVQVVLNIAGNFNGDLFCYLKYNNNLAVLLNRPGRTAANPFGYADSGFNITLSDSAANGNIHTYENVQTPAAGMPLTGVWQPDGRTTLPTSVLNTDPSPAGLSLFNGLNASGTWTLFIADMSAGGSSELMSWQLIVNPVPEPSVLALGLLSIGVAAYARRKKPGQK